MTYKARKAERAAYYHKNVYGWILDHCGACSGSGKYDDTGSPNCSCCSGTGRERVPGPKAKPPGPKYMLSYYSDGYKKIARDPHGNPIHFHSAPAARRYAKSRRLRWSGYYVEPVE